MRVAGSRWTRSTRAGLACVVPGRHDPGTSRSHPPDPRPMALATTCPQCQTSFKVVPDQLKLRKGLVRCGVCQHVFSGIDNLRYVNEPRTAPRPTVAPSNADSPDLKTAFFLPETIIGDNRADPRRDGLGPSPRRPEPPPRR